MGANLNDLYIEQGVDFSETLTLTEDGVDVDLTLYTGKASLLIEGTTTSFTIAESDNELTISLTASQTAALDSGKGKYDVELTKDSDSTVARLIKGRVFFDMEVSV